MTDKLQVQFSVREPVSERYVTFNGDVERAEVREWFIRASLAVEQLFGCANAPVALHLVDYNGQKISCIKLVREFTGTGLKEAKDLVEGNGPGASAVPRDLLFVVDDGLVARRFVERFRSANIDVALRPANVALLLEAGVLRATGKP